MKKHAQNRRARRLSSVLPESLERRQLLAADPVGPEFKVNTFTTNAQINSAAAMDADGDFVVVWQSFNQDGSGYGIYGQAYNASGASVGDEFRVNEFTTGSQTLPAVAMDADGDFVVAWQSLNQEGSGAEIWARRFTAGGTPAGSEFHVNSTTTGGQTTPAVATDDAGNFVITWHGTNPNTATYDIYAARYNASGVALQNEFVVNTYTTSTQNNTAVAMDADGDFVIFWQSFAQDINGTAVVGQRFNQAGTPQGTEIIANQFTTNAQARPTVEMDSLGNFVVAWESNTQDGSGYGIYARRYDAAGSPLSGEFQVNTFTTDQQRLPAISVDSDGDFVVAWTSRLQDESVYGIYAQAYNSAGVAQGIEFRVNTTTTNSQFTPSVAMSGTGNFVVTWQSDQQDGSSFGIYAQRYEISSLPGPEVTAAEFFYQSAPQRIEYVFNTDVSASLSNADIVLENLTTMTTIQTADISVSYDGVTNTARFTFLVDGLSWLPDGRYRATLVAAGVMNAGGTPMAADHLLEFFFLQGDANHDARVNLADFNILAANFGFSPRNFTEGDFNYSGGVTLADFNILASRFGAAVALAETVNSIRTLSAKATALVGRGSVFNLGGAQKRAGVIDLLD